MDQCHIKELEALIIWIIDAPKEHALVDSDCNKTLIHLPLVQGEVLGNWPCMKVRCTWVHTQVSMNIGCSSPHPCTDFVHRRPDAAYTGSGQRHFALLEKAGEHIAASQDSTSTTGQQPIRGVAKTPYPH